MQEKIEEALIKGAQPTKLLEDTNLKYMKNYICKISSGLKIATGFFCKTPNGSKLIPV